METILTTSLTISFKIIRLIENRLQACNFDMTMDLEIDPEFPPDLQEKKLNHIRFWLDNILNDCIAFNIHSSIATDILSELENTVMFCPDEPHDHLLLLLIMAKLNAIGDEVVVIKVASLNTDTSRGFGNSVVGDPLDLLPSPEDWMGKPRYWDQPWWNRPDGGMMDLPVGEDGDPEKKPDILIDFDPIPVQVLIEDTNTEETKSAEIIKLNFKPTVINNDKSE